MTRKTAGADDSNRTDEDAPTPECHIWVNRPEDERFSAMLVFGDTDNLDEHAPAIASSSTSSIEYLGTFDDLEERVEQGGLSIDIQETTVVPNELTEAVGRDRFWDVIEKLRP